VSDGPSHVRAAQVRAAAIAGRRPSREVLEPFQTPPPGRPRYAGLVTRAVAFAIDAAIVNGVAILVGVAVGLGVSILYLPEQAEDAIAAVMAVLWIIWSVAYFAFFWSTTGQTPGSRVMRIRVLDGAGRGPLRPLRAAARFGALILAAIPLLAGFLMMLWDDRRRCLQDRLLRTVVVDAPAPIVVARFPAEPGVLPERF
jgi:uncharacterized RDD family membrane protein YckC